MPFRFVYTSLSQTIVNTANCKSKCDPAASGAACSVVESALFHGNAAWNLQHAATAGVEAGSRQPHSGHDAFHVKTHGYGLCKRPGSTTITGFGDGGSSML